MTTSSTITIALIVNALSFAIPKFLGVTIDENTLTITIQTIVLIGTGLWTLITHKKVVAIATAQGVRGL
jgi:cyanophycinase-like exopeptidase